MTGKHTKLNQINRLRLSQGHDGIWKVRSPCPPHDVLYSDPDRYAAIRWAHRHREFARREPVWLAEDLEYLHDNYGKVPVDQICKRLNRSANALKIISFRKLGVNQRSNFYTARAVAGELGIG